MKNLPILKLLKMDVIGKNQVMISIIIPIYNVEKYLHRCIESIFQSNFKNFEIILINDGSTDKSGELINSFALEYPEIVKAYHEENRGVSFTRNRGIELSNGDYIQFIDGDDVLCSFFYDIIIPIIETQKPEILVFDHITIDNLEEDLYRDDSIIPLKAENVSKSNMIKSLFEGYYHGFVWDKLINKNFLETNKIRFDESIHFHEDNLFSFHLFDNSDNILYLNETLYFHLRNNDSAMLKYYFSTKFDERYIKTLDVFEYEKKVIYKKYPELYTYFCNAYINWCIRLYKDAKAKSFKSKELYIKLIKLISENKQFSTRSYRNKAILIYNFRSILNLSIFLKLKIKKLIK